MRKIFASLMVVVMLVMCVQPCFAALSDTIGGTAKDITLSNLVVTVTSDDYTDVTAEQPINYSATLNMEPIRNLFSDSRILGVFAEDETEFKNGIITTNVAVTVTFPKTAKFVGGTETLKTMGALETNVYEQVGERVVGDNTVTINFKNRDNLKVSDITNASNQASDLLDDIVFKLPAGVVSYSVPGAHTVSVAVAGSTLIDCASADLTANYSGSGFGTVNIAIPVNCALVDVPAVSPTCDTPGLTAAVKCATHNGYDCIMAGTVAPVEIPKLNHKDSNSNSLIYLIPGYPATCSSTGLEAHYACMLCKKDYQDTDGTTPMLNVVIPKLSHDNNVVVDAVDANCLTGASGYTAGTRCSMCNKITSGVEKVAAVHTRVTVPEIGATCTTSGTTEKKYCSECNTVFTASKEIPAKGHKFEGEWTVTTPAGQGTTGTKERLCQNGCGEKQEAVIPAEGIVHTHDTTPARTEEKLATCTEDGYKIEYCSCGEIIDEETYAKSGHTLTHNAGQEATCVADGEYEHWNCSVCHLNYRDAAATIEIKSVVKPKDINNHLLVDDATITRAATCSVKGEKIVKKCTRGCGYEKIESIDKIAHTFETISKDATCTEDGAEAHKHCTKCNSDFDMTGTKDWNGRNFKIPATGHKWGAVDTETMKQTCETCQEERTVVLTEENCPGHKWYGVTTKNASCTQPGSKHEECSLCHSTRNESLVPATGHSWDEKPEVSPTCYKTGIKAYKECSNCGMWVDTETGAQIQEKIKLDKKNHKLQKNALHQNYYDCEHGCGYRHIVAVDAEDVDEDDVDAEKTLDASEKNADIVNDIIDAADEIISEIVEKIVKGLETASDVISTDVLNKANAKNIKMEDIKQKHYDISGKKTLTHITDGEEKVNEFKIDETSGLLKIEFDITDYAGMEKIAVHRLHKEDRDGDDVYETTILEYVEEKVNGQPTGDYGEYIEINGNTLTMYVKRFSEYNIVGYPVNIGQLNPVDPPIYSGGGGGSATSTTVRFHSNGGTIVENITVKFGQTIEAPVTTRDGYIFDGWYTDASFTNKFDFSTPIKSSLNLYAKWIEDSSGSSDTICNKFSDINIDEWYHEGVHYALRNAIMVGTGATTFEPNSDVTRAMLVTVLWRAENKPAATKECAFVDLEDGQYYVDAVKWANENGVVTGTTETTFAPDNAITREQFAAIMFRYAKLKGFDVSVGENTNILSYTDFDKISEYAIPAMQYAVGSGLLKGKTATTLNPIDNATRAEMATILYRFFNANK